MGFWKDVYYDMERGMSYKDAVELNSILRDKNISQEEKKKAEAKAEAMLKLNKLK